jgi:hypothetical protein
MPKGKCKPEQIVVAAHLQLGVLRNRQLGQHVAADTGTAFFTTRRRKGVEVGSVGKYQAVPTGEFPAFRSTSSSAIRTIRADKPEYLKLYSSN